MMDIGQFSFLVMFGIRVTLIPYEKLKSPFSSIYWKSVVKIGIISALKCLIVGQLSGSVG